MPQTAKQSNQTKREQHWNRAGLRLCSEIQRLALSGEIIRAAKIQARMLDLSTLLSADVRCDISQRLCVLWEQVERNTGLLDGAE